MNSKNIVQFRKSWTLYNVGDVAGFDGKTAKILIDNGYAVLLGEDSVDPIPTDEDIGTEPENLAEAVRQRMSGDSSFQKPIDISELMDEGEIRWWKR